MKVVVEIDAEECRECRRKKEPKLRLVPRIGPVTEQLEPVVPTPQYQGSTPCMEILLMPLTMKDDQQVEFTLEFRNKKGNVVPNPPLDGIPTWVTNNSDILALTVSPDGLTCSVAAVGALGIANVTFSGDGDLGAGVVPLTGTFEITIIADPAATQVTLVPGTPTDQP